MGLIFFLEPRVELGLTLYSTRDKRFYFLFIDHANFLIVETDCCTWPLVPQVLEAVEKCSSSLFKEKRSEEE